MSNLKQLEDRFELIDTKQEKDGWFSITCIIGLLILINKSELSNNSKIVLSVMFILSTLFSLYYFYLTGKLRRKLNEQIH